MSAVTSTCWKLKKIDYLVDNAVQSSNNRLLILQPLIVCKIPDMELTIPK